MMRKSKYLRQFAFVIASILLMCEVMTGCRNHDSAIVIPSGEETDGSLVTNGNERNPDDGSTESRYSDGDVTAQNTAVSEEPVALIYVYVCGAVRNPGVVELAEGSRANDALQKAGGFNEDADRTYVNLAAKVTDGEKLYFPTITEAEEWERVAEAEQSGLVNINTADAALLMTLPGIGEARAQDIIDYRNANGDFQAKEDLQKVPGIKENMYDKLCDKIIVQ